MARWVWPTVAGVVTSATGVIINVATDLMTKPWAWVCVAVLTGLGVVVAMKVQSASSASSPAPPSVTKHGGIHNSVSGAVHGPVIQSGPIRVYNAPSVNQTAIAHENSTVHQAGRDIRSDDAP